MTCTSNLCIAPAGKGVTHRLKNAFIILVRHAVPEWKVQSIIFSLSNADVLNQTPSDLHATCDGDAYPQLSSPREEFPILVEANCHYPVGGVKRFFDTVAVMYIDVDI